MNEQEIKNKAVGNINNFLDNLEINADGKTRHQIYNILMDKNTRIMKELQNHKINNPDMKIVSNVNNIVNIIPNVQPSTFINTTDSIELQKVYNDLKGRFRESINNDIHVAVIINDSFP